MILRVLTPTQVVVEQEVIHVTVEDVTGSLGIRPGHAPLVTPLTASLVIARKPGGDEDYVAVNGGVMVVDAQSVKVVSRKAVLSSDLEHLENDVLEGFDRETEQDKKNVVAFEKMRLDFMRRILEFDRAGGEL